MNSRTLCALLLAVFALSSSGCQPGDPLERLPKEFADREHEYPFSDELHQLFLEEMKKQFGSPYDPRQVAALPINYGPPADPSSDSPSDSPIDSSAVNRGTVFELGRRVYSTHCVTCHGASGEGASMVTEKRELGPRDFRDGIFKWKSTRRKSRPLRHDLNETLRLGIPGTEMPAFAQLSDKEREATVEYVRWLSMRGEIEIAIGLSSIDFSGNKRLFAEEFAKEFRMATDKVSSDWNAVESGKTIVRPPAQMTASTPQAIEHGKQLFKSAGCSLCHGKEGQGHGMRPGLLTDHWKQPVTVEGFGSRIFHGGNASDDLYRRIVTGIDGSPMPPAPTSLKPNDIWDLLHFVNSVGGDKGQGVTRKPPPSESAEPEKQP